MRSILALILASTLGTTLAGPAQSQPWASDSARVAGRQAMEALRQNRFLEADSLSLAADPVVRKLVVWGRVQNRNGGANAAEIVGWLDANPDWPLPITVAIRAEEALFGEPDDALALRQFARSAPRTSMRRRSARISCASSASSRVTMVPRWPARVTSPSSCSWNSTSRMVP